QSMMEEALREQQEAPELPFDADVLNQQDLQQILEEARELARSGAREQAQQLLSELQRLLENLRADPQRAQEMNRQLQQSREMIRVLQELIWRQQELLDRSIKREQRGDMCGGED